MAAVTRIRLAVMAISLLELGGTALLVMGLRLRDPVGAGLGTLVFSPSQTLQVGSGIACAAFGLGGTLAVYGAARRQADFAAVGGLMTVALILVIVLLWLANDPGVIIRPFA